TEQQTVPGRRGDVDRPRAVGEVQQRLLSVSQPEPPRLVAREPSAHAPPLGPQSFLAIEVDPASAVDPELHLGNEPAVQVTLEAQAVVSDGEARRVRTSHGGREQYDTSKQEHGY